jgi:serine/threonine protein kinase
MTEKIDISDTINNKYIILKKIGSGVYGKIYKVRDEEEDVLKVIKVNKNEDIYHQSIHIEKKFLEKLNLLQKDNEELVPILYETLKFKNQICFVMKLYDINLYQYQRDNYDNNNYTIDFILLITKQIFEGINFIHNNKIIHNDIKPENILFKENRKNIIICDFGLSEKLKNEFLYFSYPIQSSYYRAPEVSIKSFYNVKIDIWSIGTILYELLSNKVLIKAKLDYDIIGKIVTIIGNPSNELIKSNENWEKYFNIFPHDSSYVFSNMGEKQYTQFSKIINHRHINDKFIKYDDNNNSFNKLKFAWLIIKKTLKWNMNERMSSKQILDLFNEHNY